MSEQSFSALKGEIQALVKAKVDEKISDKVYKTEQIKGWREEIIRDVLRELANEQFQPFKNMANCLVPSKRSKGMHTVTMSLWDPQNDRSITEQ
jgi:dynein light chain Tctex-type 1